VTGLIGKSNVTGRRKTALSLNTAAGRKEKFFVIPILLKIVKAPSARAVSPPLNPIFGPIPI
jgi:hypothetical protein